MSNSHGDLFAEIGKLVLAVNLGQTIDLDATAKDLALRYQNLRISEETLVRVVSRSIGAVRLSLASATPKPEIIDEDAAAEPASRIAFLAAASVKPAAPMQVSGRRFGGRSKTTASQEAAASQTKSLFPSGLRLALLS
jgi:hypothetical protein